MNVWLLVTNSTVTCLGCGIKGTFSLKDDSLARFAAEHYEHAQEREISRPFEYIEEAVKKEKKI